MQNRIRLGSAIHQVWKRHSPDLLMEYFLMEERRMLIFKFPDRELRSISSDQFLPVQQGSQTRDDLFALLTLKDIELL
ncbi:hypothetical protein MA16_Dca010258 [Dendrobium catenatum]|uniref:Uncharacterized protein n=1 Tax=Dendrobium catenatum TaxID=906689 RepID=A0A2I0W3C1_9ASPA|nr:hypothetical protein MA16_Dca010258 [Dendrobium catenatum]